jgi:hypothetical protein
MERAIRGRISAGRAAGELPTDADIDALTRLVVVTFYAGSRSRCATARHGPVYERSSTRRCARGRAIGRKLNVAADHERIEMGLTGLPTPAISKLGD